MAGRGKVERQRTGVLSLAVLVVIIIREIVAPEEVLSGGCQAVFERQRLSGRKALRSAARLTGRLPIAATDESRFVRRMQSEREADKKERSFEGTRFPTILSRAPKGAHSAMLVRRG